VKLLLFIQFIFTINLYGKEPVLNISRSEIDLNLSSLNKGDCDFIFQYFPQNFVQGLTDFENIHKSIIPSHNEFMAMRLTKISDDQVRIQTGLFKYKLEPDGLYLTNADDRNRKAKVEFDAMQTLYDKRYLHRYFLSDDISQDDFSNYSDEVKNLNIPFKSDKKKDLELSWKIGDKKIQIDGGVLNPYATSIIEKEIDRQLLEIELESYEQKYNGSSYDVRAQSLLDAKRLITTPLFDDQGNKTSKKERIPYISITITFP
jgi:hypothetical protein